jgi:hypothetical protein
MDSNQQLASGASIQRATSRASARSGRSAVSRASSASRTSRNTRASSMSRHNELVRKNIELQDLKPADVLIERFVAWKAIVKQLGAYFEGIADIENNTAKELHKLAGVIQVPFRAGNQFLGEGGLQVSRSFSFHLFSFSFYCLLVLSPCSRFRILSFTFDIPVFLLAFFFLLPSFMWTLSIGF